MMRILPFLLLLVAATARAQSPEDFAWQWPITLDGDDGAHHLVLDETVYARITRSDLRDLVVVNAKGESVPFAPLDEARTLREQRSELRWLRVPTPAQGQSDSFVLRLARDGDGNLRDLQVQSQQRDATTVSSDLLIDLGEEPPVVASLYVTLDDTVALPVNLRVEVLGSDDLANWTSLGRGLALVAMEDNGLRIERLRLDFQAAQQRYLRLRLPDGTGWPAITSLQDARVESESDAPGLATLTLEGLPVPGAPGNFDYRSTGPLPVQQLDLVLAQANTVAGVRFMSRDQVDGPWLDRGRSTAFRLGSGDSETRHLPTDISLTRDRHWRVVTEPALAQAPQLVLAYRPERFALLSQGPAPYALLAGSTRTQRPDYPVRAALAAVAAQQPAGWQPPMGRLGEGSAAAGGQAVLAPDRGPEHRRWLLWGVLAIGALLVLVVSIRVLRAPPAAD
jgi:hypothetical protein